MPTTLDGFARVLGPPRGWKLLVVDNGSTDDTPRVLESFSDRLPMQILTQPERGKNKALNAAIPHIEGDMAVFTDDDILVAPDWLRRIRAAADAHPDFHIFGGRIAARWPFPPPQWLLDEAPLEEAFAITPPVPEEGPVSGDFIWGANMAVRVDLFDAGMRFDEAVGPAAGNYIMGSEVEFTTRAELDGWKCWRVRDAVVEHLIQRHQLEPGWIIQRGFRAGRQRGVAEWRAAEATGWAGLPRIFGVPRWRVRRMVALRLRAALCLLAGRKRRWFRHAYAANYEKGILSEMRALCRLSRQSEL